jgi:S1-C subfamily serine protease
MDDSSFKGVRIMGIFPGSPSEKAGVQVNDIILAVDNVAISTLEEYVAQAAKRNGDMKLDILRGNSLLEIIVPSGLTESGELNY